MLKNHPMEGIKKPKVIQLEMQYYDESEASLQSKHYIKNQRCGDYFALEQYWEAFDAVS